MCEVLPCSHIIYFIVVTSGHVCEFVDLLRQCVLLAQNLFRRAGSSGLKGLQVLFHLYAKLLHLLEGCSRVWMKLNFEFLEV